MRMGLPHVILSDNGKEFNNNLDKSLATLLGIQRRLTTPYHPQVEKPKLAIKIPKKSFVYRALVFLCPYDKNLDTLKFFVPAGDSIHYIVVLKLQYSWE